MLFTKTLLQAKLLRAVSKMWFSFRCAKRWAIPSEELIKWKQNGFASEREEGETLTAVGSFKWSWVAVTCLKPPG